MNRAIVVAAIAVCTFNLTVSRRTAVAETNTPASPAHRAVGIEVFIVDVKGGAEDEHALGFSGPSDEVAARLQELESQGRIVVIERIRLTTIENQKSLFQAGRTAPLASGRSTGGRAGGVQTSYRQQNLGTLISTTARVDGEAIVVELDVEKSQLERRAGRPQPEDEFVPLATETLTCQNTLRIGSGKTVLVGSLERTAAAESSAQLILASARFLEPSTDAKDVATTGGVNTRQTRIFSLQHTRAKDAAPVVEELTDVDDGRINVNVDSRTNSLIVSAEKEHHLDVVEAILLRLDESDRWRAPEVPKDDEKSDSTPVVTEYEEMEKQGLQEELQRLQKEVLDAERPASQAKEKAAEAAREYKSASDDEKPDALLRMIEADAESRKSIKSYMQIRSDFDAAQRAYLRLLVAE